MRRIRALTLVPFLAAILAAATSPQGDGFVWIVDDDGPADFTTVQGAVVASKPGDRILVRDGDYPGFAIVGKTLTVEADAGATVRIQGTIEVAHLLSIESVFLRGLHTSETVVPPSQVATLWVHGGVGKAWVEDCSFGVPLTAATSDFDSDAAYVQAGNAILVRSTFHGGAGRNGARGGAGLFMTTGNVWVHGCTFTGGPGLEGRSAGGHGVLQDGGFLSIAGSILRGGDGADGADLATCNDGADGGHGALLVGNSPVQEAHDLADAGGKGGTSLCGAPGADGRPRLVTVASLVTDYPGVAVRAEIDSPVVVGAPLTAELSGAPGDLIVLAAMPKLHVIDVPTAIGWLLIGDPFRGFDRFVLPPSGTLAKTYTAPPIGTLVSQPFLVQPIAFRFGTDGPRVINGAPSAVGILSTAF